jgi:hypothetical protein
MGTLGREACVTAAENGSSPKRMPVVQSECKLLPQISDVPIATQTSEGVLAVERGGVEAGYTFVLSKSAVGALGAVSRAPNRAHSGIPTGAAVALAVAGAKKDGVPRSREYFVAFGGERPPDGSGRCAPTSDLVIIDSDGDVTNRLAPAESSTGAWWPEPRKFAAAATVYKAGGFAIFDEEAPPEGRKNKGKAPVAAATAASTPVASSAAAPPAGSTAGSVAAVTIPSRKSSAGAIRDAAAVARDQAVEDLLPSFLTGACTVIFGGVDAAGRFSDDIFLLNVEAALADTQPPPPLSSAATGKDAATSSAGNLPSASRRRWWVSPPRPPDGTGPAGRAHHTLTVLPPGNAIALFGGYGLADSAAAGSTASSSPPEPVPLSDVWLLDIQVRLDQ